MKGRGWEDKRNERKKVETSGCGGPGAKGGGKVHPPSKGEPLLATSPGSAFAVMPSQNLLFSMPIFASALPPHSPGAEHFDNTESY